MSRRHFVPGKGKLMPSGRRKGGPSSWWRPPPKKAIREAARKNAEREAAAERALRSLEKPVKDFGQNLRAEYGRSQERADDRRFEAFVKRLGQQYSATGKAEGTILDLKRSNPERDAQEIVQRLHRHGYRAVTFAPFGEDKKRGIRIVGWVNR